ncbi:MAG TPA: SHOCT domain-containing protein [Streptosporangiaceae bacterium]|nr:SHOCT domain-containing protein [Streptosporangiaceae bacterium]
MAGTAANMGAKSAQRSAEAAQAEAAPPADAPADEAPPEAAESPQIQELRQLAALKDQGILTEEEFSAKKAQILGL